MLALRRALVELLDELKTARSDDHKFNRTSQLRIQFATKLVHDLDAGELLWPGWKKGRA